MKIVTNLFIGGVLAFAAAMVQAENEAGESAP